MTDEAVKSCPFCKETPSVGLCGNRVMHDCKALGAFIISTVDGWNTRAERTCKPRIVARTFVGDDEPSFWQAICECGWIVGEDGTPNLSDFEHVDSYCGGCGAKVVRE